MLMLPVPRPMMPGERSASSGDQLVAVIVLRSGPRADPSGAQRQYSDTRLPGMRVTPL